MTDKGRPSGSAINPSLMIFPKSGFRTLSTTVWALITVMYPGIFDSDKKFIMDA
jgi:hypothetical protein